MYFSLSLSLGKTNRITTTSNFSTYLRPDGVSLYKRPDGTSTYIRP